MSLLYTNMLTESFWREALSAHKDYTLSLMAKAIMASRKAAEEERDSTSDSKRGLMRIWEIENSFSLNCTHHIPLDGMPQTISTEIAYLYVFLSSVDLSDPSALAVYAELEEIMKDVSAGVWFD